MHGMECVKYKEYSTGIFIVASLQAVLQAGEILGSYVSKQACT